MVLIIDMKLLLCTFGKVYVHTLQLRNNFAKSIIIKNYGRWKTEVRYGPGHGGFIACSMPPPRPSRRLHNSRPSVARHTLIRKMDVSEDTSVPEAKGKEEEEVEVEEETPIPDVIISDVNDSIAFSTVNDLVLLKRVYLLYLIISTIQHFRCCKYCNL